LHTHADIIPERFVLVSAAVVVFFIEADAVE